LSYSSLLLFDIGKPLNEENLNKLFAASNNKIDPMLVKTFVRGIKGKNIGSYLAMGGGG
jgi:ribosomal protein L12E/L44/L45/RPP1/RPP2